MIYQLPNVSIQSYYVAYFLSVLALMLLSFNFVLYNEYFNSFKYLATITNGFPCSFFYIFKFVEEAILHVVLVEVCHEATIFQNNRILLQFRSLLFFQVLLFIFLFLFFSFGGRDST